MNSEQQPSGQPSKYNLFAEIQDDESCRQIAIKMQQNFNVNDTENNNNSLSSHLKHFVAVASAIIVVEKALETNHSDNG